MDASRKTTSKLGQALLGVAPLLAQKSPAQVIEAAIRLLVEQFGASSGAILILKNERVSAEHWYGADGALRASLGPHFREATLSLPTGSEAKSAVAPTRTGPLVSHRHEGELLLLRTGPLGPTTEPLGAVCLAFARPDDTPPPDDAAIDAVCDIVAGCLATSRQLAEFRSEKARHERWFRTLDNQLRVLDRERQKFVAVVNQSDTYMFVVEPTHLVKWTNAAMGSRLEKVGAGVSWIDQSLQEIWYRLDLKGPRPGSTRCPVARAFRENVVVHQELRQERGSEMRNLYLTALPIKGPDGKPDEVLIMIQDVTDLEVLRRSEARYRSLFERSPDAMVMVDPETRRILLANPVAFRLSGYDPDELLQHSVEELHDPQDWDEARALYELAFTRNEPVVSECVLVTKGRKRVVTNMSAARFDLDGSPVILVEFQDITEQKRLQDELRHSHKMEAIGRLAGGVAHDFNNLLTIIMGHSEMLVGRLEQNERLARTAQSVHKAAVRGSLLTRQLLAFSRKDVLKSEVLDLRDIVLGIEAMVRSLIGEKVELATDLGSSPCLVRADRSQMEQIIMNLVVNARDAMPAHGGNIRIETCLSDELERDSRDRYPGTHAVLIVRDNGKGMDTHVQTRLFEPFFTTKEQGKGTGLGLSSVYGIIKDCGGEIEVASVPGEGTHFTIHIPIVEGEAKAAVLESAVAGIYQPGSGTILLVEDEEEVRALAIDVLQMSGYSVLQASSGEEALRLLEQTSETIELLLTDVIMPGMGGGELVRRVAHTMPRMKVLYMSGYSDDDLVQHGVSGSEAWFLQKPFTLEALTTKVRDVLETAP